MLLFLAAGIAVVGGPTLRAADMAVVPRPAEIKVRSGSFTHNAHTVIGELRSRIVPQLAQLDPMKAAYYVDSPAAPAAAKPAQQGQAAGKARTTPPPPPQVIGLSCAVPVAGQPVTVSVDVASQPQSLVIVYPDGSEHRLPLDAKGQVTWKPAHYGKYVLHCGKAT